MALIVAVGTKLFGEKVIGEASGLFKAVHSIVNFKVDPTAVHVDGEVVLVDEFLWNVADFYADVFRVIEWRAQVEIGDVETGKPSVGRG